MLQPAGIGVESQRCDQAEQGQGCGNTGRDLKHLHHWTRALTNLRPASYLPDATRLRSRRTKEHLAFCPPVWGMCPKSLILRRYGRRCKGQPMSSNAQTRRTVTADRVHMP